MIFTVMEGNLCDIYGDGSMHNPKYSMDIEARLTRMIEDLSNDYSDGGTLCDGRRLCIIFLDLTIQVQPSNCAAVCDCPFSITLTLLHSFQSMITMITTAGVKQGANNSFTTNNYSGTPTQHTKTGE